MERSDTFSFETLNLKYLKSTQAECRAGDSVGESEAQGRNLSWGGNESLISIQVVAEMLSVDKFAQEEDWYSTEKSSGLKTDTWVTGI